jgi:hypothetical protein
MTDIEMMQQVSPYEELKRIRSVMSQYDQFDQISYRFDRIDYNEGTKAWFICFASVCDEEDMIDVFFNNDRVEQLLTLIQYSPQAPKTMKEWIQCQIPFLPKVEQKNTKSLTP